LTGTLIIGSSLYKKRTSIKLDVQIWESFFALRLVPLCRVELCILLL